MEKRFGDVARKARVQARLSLSKVAMQLGWSTVYVSDIERGMRKPPSQDKARAWAEAIGADPEEFVRLALVDRDAVELPMADDSELALALARHWSRLTAEQRKGLMKILNEDEE